MDFTITCPHCQTVTKYTPAVSTPTPQHRPESDVIVESWLATIPQYKTSIPRRSKEWFDAFTSWANDEGVDVSEITQRKFATAAINNGATYTRVSGGHRVYSMPAIGPSAIDDEQLAADIQAVNAWTATMDPAEIEQWLPEKHVVALYESTTPDHMPRQRFLDALRVSFSWEHTSTPVRGYVYAATGNYGDDDEHDDDGPEGDVVAFPELPDGYGGADHDDGGDGSDNPGISLAFPLTVAELLSLGAPSSFPEILRLDPPDDGGHTNDGGTTFPELPEH